MPDPQGAPFPMGFFDTFNCHSAVLARENLPIPDRKVKKKKKKVLNITESANTN